MPITDEQLNIKADGKGFRLRSIQSSNRNWDYSSGKAIAQWDEGGVFCAAINPDKHVGLSLITNPSSLNVTSAGMITNKSMQDIVEQYVGQLTGPYVVVAGPFTKLRHDKGPEILGDIVEDFKSLATYRSGDDEGRAFLVYRDFNGSCEFEIGAGAPPLAVKVAISGLCPLIIGGTKYSDSHPHYKNNKARSPDTGKTIVGIRENGIILVVVQPDHAGVSWPLDDVTNELESAGFVDALLLDGSDSVTMYHNRVWKTKQNFWKARYLPYAVCFS